ncbi:MAG TPA: 4-(cytidine 5'-diphospho)-2-C-methyl-D-erythritol kinase [Sphingobacteriaceae bacterium]
MVAFPNAKINIGLHVTERRGDGYHNLETVFYPVAVHDVVEVVEAPELKLTSSGIGIPGDLNGNLCIKAYQLLAEDHDIPLVHIHLHKHIPIGAGLGGGSSDAAFFLKLMNTKFALGLTEVAMEAYCRRLGADCAFFIKNKPVFAFGKGDEFKEVTLDLSSFHLVLVKPGAHVSTGEAYRGVQPRVPPVSLAEVIKKPVAEWKDFIRNDFEASVFKDYPSIRDIKAALYDAGALYASMSGSGSSVYGIFETKPELSALETHNLVFYGV